MLKKALAGVGVVIAVFAGVVAMQPSEFTVERSATMKASPDIVFGLINDFHAWQDWSPWAKLDPQMKTTYTGAPMGVGSEYAWLGNDDVGEGKMTITTVRPNEAVTVKLEFIKPFAATNTTLFTLKGQDDSTMVTWAMSGENNFVSKAFCLFMDMDAMVGKDFEKGLASMTTLAEAAAQKAKEEASKVAAGTEAQAVAQP